MSVPAMKITGNAWARCEHCEDDTTLWFRTVTFKDRIVFMTLAPYWSASRLYAGLQNGKQEKKSDTRTRHNYPESQELTLSQASGIIPFPNLYVILFEHNNPDTIIKIWDGTRANTNVTTNSSRKANRDLYIPINTSSITGLTESSFDERTEITTIVELVLD